MRGLSSETDKRIETSDKTDKSGVVPLQTARMDHSSWLQLSVQDFFSQCNWLGRPIAIQNGQDADPSSRLHLPVGEFFRLLPWEGTPQVGFLPKVSSLPDVKDSEPEEVTLTDLLDLF